MPSKTRVLLEVGSYSSSQNFSVIGEPSKFYLWHKRVNSKGNSSGWFSGNDAFQHFNRMRELLVVNKNEDAFVSYLTDLFHSRVSVI